MLELIIGGSGLVISIVTAAALVEALRLTRKQLRLNEEQHAMRITPRLLLEYGAHVFPVELRDTGGLVGGLNPDWVRAHNSEYSRGDKSVV